MVATVDGFHDSQLNSVSMWVTSHEGIRHAERQNPVASAFVPVALPAVPSSGRHIEIRLSRGHAQATVQWPVSEAGACVAWLREWLR